MAPVASVGAPSAAAVDALSVRRNGCFCHPLGRFSGWAGRELIKKALTQEVKLVTGERGLGVCAAAVATRVGCESAAGDSGRVGVLWVGSQVGSACGRCPPIDRVSAAIPAHCLRQVDDKVQKWRGDTMRTTLFLVGSVVSLVACNSEPEESWSDKKIVLTVENRTAAQLWYFSYAPCGTDNYKGVIASDEYVAAGDDVSSPYLNPGCYDLFIEDQYGCYATTTTDGNVRAGFEFIWTARVVDLTCPYWY